MDTLKNKPDVAFPEMYSVMGAIKGKLEKILSQVRPLDEGRSTHWTQSEAGFDDDYKNIVSIAPILEYKDFLKRLCDVNFWKPHEGEDYEDSDYCIYPLYFAAVFLCSDVFSYFVRKNIGYRIESDKPVEYSKYVRKSAHIDAPRPEDLELVDELYREMADIILQVAETNVLPFEKMKTYATNICAIHGIAKFLPVSKLVDGILEMEKRLEEERAVGVEMYMNLKAKLSEEEFLRLKERIRSVDIDAFHFPIGTGEFPFEVKLPDEK